MLTYRCKYFLYFSQAVDPLSLLRSFDFREHHHFTGIPRIALHRLPMLCRP